MHDISSTHVSTLISEVFRCSHLVLAAPTYNNGVYPAMATFLHDMKALGLQNRTVALVENGSWAPVSGKLMREMLGELKGFQVLEPWSPSSPPSRTALWNRSSSSETVFWTLSTGKSSRQNAAHRSMTDGPRSFFSRAAP